MVLVKYNRFQILRAETASYMTQNLNNSIGITLVPKTELKRRMQYGLIAPIFNFQN